MINNYLFYIISILILIILISNSSKYNICDWNNSKKYLLPNHKDNYKVKLIKTLLSKLNIVYFIIEGSLLGCYRNGGFIQGDNDFDIALPVWLNSKIFHCNEKISVDILKYGYNCLSFPDYYTVCNYTKKHYHAIFYEYAKPFIKNIRHNFQPQVSVIGLFFPGFTVDLWIMIGDEESYREIKLCNCIYSGVYITAIENAAISLLSKYGPEFYKPIPKKNSNYKCQRIHLK